MGKENPGFKVGGKTAEGSLQVLISAKTNEGFTVTSVSAATAIEVGG